MFKEDLQKYNELFDECTKIECKFGKEYDEETQPIMDEMNRKVEEFEKFKNELNKDVEATQNLQDKLSRRKLGFFESLTEYSDRIAKNAKDAISVINRNKSIFSDVKSELMLNGCNNLLKEFGNKKDIFVFKKPLLNVILFSILIVGFLSMCTVSAPWIRITSMILAILSLIIVIGTMVYCKIRKKLVEKNLSSCKFDVEKYIKDVSESAKNSINKKYIEINKELDELKLQLDKIGDKYEKITDDATKEIKVKINSYKIINKSIQNLLEYYKDEIKWSADYMHLFEKNFYMNFENEQDFISSCRDLIEKKKKDDEEKAEKRRQEKERKQIEYERWKAQEEVKRHNREMEYAQKKQADALQKQQDEQRKAACSLCGSCKYYTGCSLKHNLSSPVCSRYQNKY